MVGVWRGDVSCLSQTGSTVVVTGTISLGEERAQNLNLAGRTFRVSVTDGAPDTFRVQVASPQAPFAPCSAPTTPVNTVTEGDLSVAFLP